jgi:hypothetical protein
MFVKMKEEKYYFFFSLMTRQGGACRSPERSKNHTRSVFYEKTEILRANVD